MTKYNEEDYRFLPILVGRGGSVIGSRSFMEWVANPVRRNNPDSGPVEVAILFPNDQTTAGEMASVLSELGKLSIPVVLLKATAKLGVR